MCNPQDLGCIRIGDLARILWRHGVENIGFRRLRTWLRNDGFLIAHGVSCNMPTPETIEAGLMIVKETRIYNPNGETQTIKTPMVTGYGQIYFVNKYLNERGKHT